jgi:hypothetical protein
MAKKAGVAIRHLRSAFANRRFHIARLCLVYASLVALLMGVAVLQVSSAVWEWLTAVYFLTVAVACLFALWRTKRAGQIPAWVGSWLGPLGWVYLLLLVTYQLQGLSANGRFLYNRSIEYLVARAVALSLGGALLVAARCARRPDSTS